ncbi:MAG: Arc family DNA-binding protein [Oscillospiraceae bacterium]|nr:Arc family DNA-binding protein [Oscillospiraceae bacterium]
MASLKRVFTLRLHDEVFDKVEVLAKEQHRSMTNLIEYIILSHLAQHENEHGEIDVPK